MNKPRICQGLVEKEVKGFLDYRILLLEEDIKEHGSKVFRPPGAIHDLYNIYLDFQTSEEAIHARSYYYG